MAAIFQASRPQCLVLRVTILRGKNVTLGWWNDLADTPDPYVKLYLPQSPNGRRTTKVISNDANPTWNETFEFYMDPEQENVMNVTLMEGDLVFDDTIQTKSVNLNKFEQDVDHEKDLVFSENIHVYIKINITKSKEVPEGVRFSTSITEKEIEFREKRKQFVFKAMQAVLGERGPKNIDEVPTVGILGSGGGFRAMTALSGTSCALKDIGIVDCSMYFAGLSGSSWYISTLYSHPNWPKIHPVEVNKEIRECVAKNWVRLLFTPSWLYKRISAIMEKQDRGEPVSFTDLFGYLIGDTLLLNRENPLLSDQMKTFEDGTIPMPLYACVHVKKDVSAEIFSEWVELSPFEIGMLKYGTYLTPEKFGNKYFCGVSVADFPEPSLHFIQGFCGSAFTILMQRILADPAGADEHIKELKSHCDDGQTALRAHVHSSATDHVDNEDSDDETAETKPAKKCCDHQNGNNNEEQVNDESTWDSIVNYVVNKVNFLKTRDGRAAQIYNFLRGLELIFNSKDHAKDEIAIKKLTASSKSKRMMVCDAGLVFNSPYPLLMRTDRQVDLILSFDYSAREKDDLDVSSFGELIKAEQWAKSNNYPFPPINHEEQFKKYGTREYYVFKNDDDPKCPVVIHFPLVNNLFKTFKAPGIPRTTLAEVEEGKMSIFEDVEQPYSTFNFHYLNKPYDRLVELANFNAKVCNDVICDEMAKCVEKKRKNKDNGVSSKVAQH